VSLSGALAAAYFMSMYRHRLNRGKSWTILVFGFLLGGVSIWSIHFIGLTATELSITSIDGQKLVLPQTFSPSITFLSAIAIIVFVAGGGAVAGTDPFFGCSTEEAT